MIIVSIALISVLIYITGLWDSVYDLMFGGEGAGQIWINVLLLAVLVGAVIAVLKGKDKDSDDDEDKD